MSVFAHSSGEGLPLPIAHSGAPTNALLAALSPAAFSLLHPHLRERAFEERSVLWEAGDEADQIFFPQSGIISIVLPFPNGAGIEVASVGREAGAGMEFATGASPRLTRGAVLVSGVFSSISVSQFARAAAQDEEVHKIAVLSCDWLLRQAQQMAACNAAHAADARFCRWLLQSCERMESGLVTCTQETIAHLLGLQRTTLTMIAQRLQVAGIISYRRGKIMVLDRDALQSAACECCAALSRRHWPAERMVRNAKPAGLRPGAG